MLVCECVCDKCVGQMSQFVSFASGLSDLFRGLLRLGRRKQFIPDCVCACVCVCVQCQSDSLVALATLDRAIASWLYSIRRAGQRGCCLPCRHSMSVWGSDRLPWMVACSIPCWSLRTRFSQRDLDGSDVSLESSSLLELSA